jgi:DnaK suppressor protein
MRPVVERDGRAPRRGEPAPSGNVRTASSRVTRRETDALSPDALDRLRGILLAEREVRCAQLAAHEAMLVSAPADAFGAELRRITRASIARDRDAISGVDDELVSLVRTYGSCEWCGTVIPAQRLKTIPAARLCLPCRRRSLPNPVGARVAGES